MILVTVIRLNCNNLGGPVQFCTSQKLNIQMLFYVVVVTASKYQKTTRCSTFEVLQSTRAVDGKGDLCLHRRANREEGPAESSNMGAVFTPRGEVKQVRMLHILHTTRL